MKDISFAMIGLPDRLRHSRAFGFPSQRDDDVRSMIDCSWFSSGVPIIKDVIYIMFGFGFASLKKGIHRTILPSPSGS